MSWKIVKIETLDVKSILCPVCNIDTPFQTVSERNQIIKEHSNCIAGESISFRVAYYVFPTCTANCSLCQQPRNSLDISTKNGQVICKPCEATVADIYGWSV